MASSSSLTRTGGQLLVDTLAARGVDVVFGVPAAQTLAIYQALRDRAPAVAHVTARHEQGAGFMAEGFARATGRVGVACVVTGVGLANTLAPMASAWADSVPLLVVSSQVPTFWADMPARQYNHFLRHSSAGVAASVSKRSIAVARPEDVPGAVASALELARAGRPGPVHVEVPVDVLRARATGRAPGDAEASAGDGLSSSSSSCSTTATSRDTGLSDSVAAQLCEAARNLRQCQRPLIIVGGGAVDVAPGQLAALAEALDAPVVATIAAKGLLDEDHALALGTRLHVLSARDESLFHASDGVLLLGTQLSPVDWWLRAIDEEVPLPRAAATLVQVDIDPATLVECRRAHPGIHGIEACAGPACAALLQELRRLGPGPGPAVREAVRSARLDADSAEALAATLGARFGRPEDVGEQMRATLAALHAALPERSVVTADLCRLAYVAWSLLPARAPRNFLYPTGAGPLGFGLPAAIGASLARPGVPVAVLVGDGGFQFSLQELAVAVEHNLPILILLWNNRCLGEVRHHLGDGFANFDPARALPDFAAIAGAYGVAHRRCGCAAEVAEALREDPAARRVLRGEGGPVLIEVLRLEEE